MNTSSGAKRILCYGDSNTWGWIPSKMGTQRYPIDKRWPGILQKKLGNKIEVIEEGLGGRTTNLDDPRPDFPERNGLKTLPIILESHLPLDYVILMLGTTDTKEMFHLSAKRTTAGLKKIVQTIKKYKTLTGTKPPGILVVVPPIVDETTDFASKLFRGGTQKAKELRKLYRSIAKEEGVSFLDPTQTVTVDPNEGVHIDASNHKKLALLIYEKIVMELT